MTMGRLGQFSSYRFKRKVKEGKKRNDGGQESLTRGEALTALKNAQGWGERNFGRKKKLGRTNSFTELLHVRVQRVGATMRRKYDRTTMGISLGPDLWALTRKKGRKAKVSRFPLPLQTAEHAKLLRAGDVAIRRYGRIKN